MARVHVHSEVEGWFLDTGRGDPVTADLVTEAVDLVAEHGASVGRPLVRRVLSGRFYTINELDPGRAGANESRLLFAFGPTREAAFLVAGAGSVGGAVADVARAGEGPWWWSWFLTARPLADERYEQFLTDVESGAAPRDMVDWRDVKDAVRAADAAWDSAERRARRSHIRQEMLASVTAARLEFASILQRLMDSRRLTARAVSEASGRSVATIYNLLGGIPPSPALLDDLAPVLQIPVADLLVVAGLPTMPEPVGRRPYRARWEIGRLLAIARHLTPEQVERLIESAQNLRDGPA